MHPSFINDGVHCSFGIKGTAYLTVTQVHNTQLDRVEVDKPSEPKLKQFVDGQKPTEPELKNGNKLELRDGDEPTKSNLKQLVDGNEPTEQELRNGDEATQLELRERTEPEFRDGDEPNELEPGEGNGSTEPELEQLLKDKNSMY